MHCNAEEAKQGPYNYIILGDESSSDYKKFLWKAASRTSSRKRLFLPRTTGPRRAQHMDGLVSAVTSVSLFFQAVRDPEAEINLLKWTQACGISDCNMYTTCRSGSKSPTGSIIMADRKLYRRTTKMHGISGDDCSKDHNSEQDLIIL